MAKGDRIKQRYSKALAVYQDTSREAWEAFQELMGPTDAAITRCIRDSGTGLCSEGVELALGMKHQTVSAQIRHMVEAGVLYDSGRRVTVTSGRKAIVWDMSPPPTQPVGIIIA